jgi:hypothetical protein
VTASEKLIALVDELAEAADDVGREFDYLVFGTEELRYDKDGATGVMGAQLSFLQDSLHKLQMDLRTVGEPT